MFILHLFGEGHSNGNHCDYYISCNETVRFLPKHLATMKDAEQHVLQGDYLDEIESATIYEVVDEKEIDIKAYLAKCKAERAAAERKATEDRERQEYEKLKKKFETKSKVE